MALVLEILSLSILSLIMNSVNYAGSIQIVTCPQHGEAVLSFHFPFISGAEDLDVTIMKMESIRDTKPTVIYVIDKGTEEYYAAQYRDRTEIRNDLPSGKLELILKHVEESDAGIYKCQATNKKNHDEMMIQLYIERSVKPTEIMAAEGDSVTFQADYFRPRTEVVWKIEEDKLVEVNQNSSHYYRLADRASTSFHSGSLTIRDLVESDSGNYSGNILTEGKYHETKFILKVSLKPTDIIEEEGESVTFRADYSRPRTEVVWKIGEDKLMELNQNSSHYYRLADRASASFHSGSLTIRDLVESDSGNYSRNILTEGKYQETKFILKVSPFKPEVHYNVTNGAITVYCESNSTGVTYEWRNSSGDLLSTGAVYTAPPETLRINDTVTCIVRNKVSESSSSVTIEDYTHKENTNRNRIYLILIIASSLILVFLVMNLIIFWCKRRSLRSSRNSQEYPEESHLSVYSDSDNLLDSPVKPEKPESPCDIDYEFDIKDVSKSKDNDLYTGRERENNVNNDVTINSLMENWKEMRT